MSLRRQKSNKQGHKLNSIGKQMQQAIPNVPQGSENELSPGGRFIAMFGALSNR